MRIEHVTVTEELEEFLHFAGDMYIDTIIDVNVEYIPGEKQTHNYPGCPSTFEVESWSTKELQIATTDGIVKIPVQNDFLKDKWDLWPRFEQMVQDYLNENEEHIFEDAAQIAAENEEAAKDAYADYKFQLLRDGY